MDIIRAKEIISALAEGVDPTTGEVLPDNSVCNKGEVVRAFYAILNHLDEKKPKKNKPANAGKQWSAAEDEKMLLSYRSGIGTAEIAKMLKRTKGSIAARLVKLGEIKDRIE
jgi:hypothetical protein